ncbi:pyocin activator PrtN family protein [Paraburkholderia kururiensis]|uniref:pyocin activator PrtN family protein n=1 Tax=Paraburkholderia kururiensis TaxID=984307 RepID=UPI0018F30D55|nr:pyocin activator PrtN family protein [Paraburkholderia kururiensis]
MNTAFLLIAQFGAQAVIPIEDVRKAYFSHIDSEKFMRKLSSGDIPLPVMRAEKSQKSGKFIGMMDLAVYLDVQMEAGRREYKAMRSAAGGGRDSSRRFVEILLNQTKNND